MTLTSPPGSSESTMSWFIMAIPSPAFTIAMAMYFVMTFVCSRLLRWWESKMDGPDSYELYDLSTTDTLAHTTGLYSYPKRPKTGNQNLDIRDGGR